MSFLRVLQRSAVTAGCRRTLATATNKGASPSPKKFAADPKVKSSCPADTLIIGVNYLKGQQPVLAKLDEEYPEWLWTILQPKVWPDDGPGGKAEKVRRRKENRQRIKDANFLKSQ